MNRIPTLLIMPIIYALVLLMVPFAVLLMVCEMMIYKLKGLK